MSTTILAPIVLTVLGIIFGIILAIASKVFAVEKEPREEASVRSSPAPTAAAAAILAAAAMPALW